MVSVDVYIIKIIIICIIKPPPVMGIVQLKLWHQKKNIRIPAEVTNLWTRESQESDVEPTIFSTSKKMWELRHVWKHLTLC